jgi:hypothetical protein
MSKYKELVLFRSLRIIKIITAKDMATLNRPSEKVVSVQGNIEYSWFYSLKVLHNGPFR